MRKEIVPADRVIARIAARQHGVITYEQLLRAGLSAAGIARRIEAGRLYRIYRGVYAVGHAGVTRKGRWKAATLALGDDALLSHRSAAELWGMLKPSDGPIHVTVPRTGGRARRRGIRVHRPHSYPARMSRDNIPVTSPARTIADLRATEPARVVRRAIREAELAGLPLEDVATDRTRSDLERDFLRLCRRHRLPVPEVNARIAGFEVDFAWPDRNLVVEVDGYAFHRGRQAFRDDRDRDIELELLGFTVLRFADTRIEEDPDGVATTLRAFLLPADGASS
jgi:very-short-patch-repair endonuclease